MKTLFVLNDPPYGTERSYNGLRLEDALAKRDGEAVRVFLMGGCRGVRQGGPEGPPGPLSLGRMIQVVAQHRGEIGVCGSCMDARGLQDAELMPGSRRSTLEELADLADRVLLF